MTTLTPDLDERTSYELIAPHYDAFTDHPGHTDWFRRLESLACRHGVTGRRALDVGCGTGKSTAALLELGYEVVGCEPSPQMLVAAEQRVGARARLVCASAQELPELGRFDYISCVGDICNYMLEPGALRAALAAMAANLADGGVLLFDLNTPVTYLEHFTATSYTESAAGKFIWRGFDSSTFGPNGVVEGAIELFEPVGDLWRHRSVRHVQRHYDRTAAEAALGEAGLSIVAIYGQTDAGLPEQPANEETHTKTIYLARRASY